MIDKQVRQIKNEIKQISNQKNYFKASTKRKTSSKELKLDLDAIGSIRAFICSHASNTAAPYMSELICRSIRYLDWQEN